MTATFLATGGAAAPLPVLRSQLAPTEAVSPYLRRIEATSMNSNHGRLFREFAGGMVASHGARDGVTGVRVEHGAKLGIGTRIATRLRVGRCAMLGAGAVVIRDVALGATVGSVLAREWSRSPATPEQSERLA